jgi:hypothetical protein
MLIGNKFADYESNSVRVELLSASVSHSGNSGLFCELFSAIRIGGQLWLIIQN